MFDRRFTPRPFCPHVRQVRSPRFSMFRQATALLWLAAAPTAAWSQWVISAMHPDPTPPVGAPTAEFVALWAEQGGDSCRTLDGYSLSWNGQERVLPNGCWTAGSLVVAHRAADSAAFDFGMVSSLPLASWPALVNGGSTVVLSDAGGQVVDAMTYSSEDLGPGGRPLMRSNLRACGSSSNLHLWTFGSSPFLDTTHTVTEVGFGTEEALALARSPERLVPRGPGWLHWYIGTSMDPAILSGCSATVGGRTAQAEWPTDSVVELRWSGRPEQWPGPDGPLVHVAVGPLRACRSGSRPMMFTSAFMPVATRGDVEIIGVHPDPVPDDPHLPFESLALHNGGHHPLDLSALSFGGGRLRHRKVLPPGQAVTLESPLFDGWPGMPNDGGSVAITSPSGALIAQAHWSPCDHELEALVGSGLGLVREPAAGSTWHTSGHPEVEAAPPQVVGLGCPSDGAGHPIGLDVHLDRYVEHWPENDWSVVGVTTRQATGSSAGPQTLRLTWAGMEVDLAGGTALRLRAHPELEPHDMFVRCPPLGMSPEPACLRIVELMWDAAGEGGEFVELMNCGTAPLDLAGLQGTTASFPYPSDWMTWVEEEMSLVLQPGEVMAFGECARWYGRGLPERGPARWNVGPWRALNDQSGSLSIRLPSVSAVALDAVEWNDGLEGPWWWQEDGWAWVRSGSGPAEWTPAPDRGSPGRNAWPWVSSCDGAVTFTTDGEVPGLAWRLPAAGGTITVDLVGWPSGTLAGHWTLEDVPTEGQWTWSGRGSDGRAVAPGPLMWNVRWRSGPCQGRNRQLIRTPRSG